MPLAGGFLSGPEKIAGETLYPLRVKMCRVCGLLQIVDVIDPEILFQDYTFSSSTVPPLVDHFRAYAQWLKDSLNPASVVEFGCNDGILLEPLSRLGVKAIGVDVSRNITDLARQKGLEVLTGYFDVETARRIREEHGPVDVVTGSNAFAHNDHPERILEAARAVLKESGHLCLEVMYAGDLLEKLQWDTLYHEHLTFYSLGSLRALLQRYGFSVVDALRLPMHGGSLRVCAVRQADPLAKASVAELLQYETETGLTELQTWHGFANRSRRKIEIVADTFGVLSREKSIYGYGAAGKATFWVNASHMDYLGGVVDASPLRIGRLMPGTHTPIVSPEAFRQANPDIVFVSAWNYADLIRSKESWHTGMWAVPLPDLRIF